MQTANLSEAILSITQNISNPASAVQQDFKIAGKTAIVRKITSAPLRFALENNLVQGKCLNFGKGKATVDTEAMQKVAESVWEFDFVHAPNLTHLNSTFDTVYAGYVLNVLPRMARDMTIKMIARVTRENGFALIAVRSTKESTLKKTMKTAQPFEDGIRTSSGTFQKAYTPTALAMELLKYFPDVQIYKTPGGFEFARCSHRGVN